MKRIATLLSIAAAIAFLSNCADIPYSNLEFDESYNRALNDSAYDWNACRAANHDFRYCR